MLNISVAGYTLSSSRVPGKEGGLSPASQVQFVTKSVLSDKNVRLLPKGEEDGRL